MMRLLFIGLMALMAVPVFAAEAMLGDTFNQTTLGQTYDFSVAGNTYGREIYLPNHQVIWDTLQGETCLYGTWYSTNTAICFVYENQPNTPKCWNIFPEVGGEHIALFENNPNDERPYTMVPTSEPMMCTGPEVGS